MIEIVGIETEKVSIEKNLADEEEEKVAVIAEEVSKKQKDCEEDLTKAEPALLAAQEALNTLNKANLTELKSFGSPPGKRLFSLSLKEKENSFFRWVVYW